MSRWWWLQSRAYLLFIVRELTCVFVAYFAIVSIWLIRALSQGSDVYAQFMAWMRAPAFTVLNSLALLALLFHAITFFNLSPSLIALRRGDERVPNWVIAAPLYLVSIILSAVVAWILLRA